VDRRLATAAFVALAVLPLFSGSDYLQSVIIGAVLFAFVTTGMNLIFGFAGQPAFGHPVFFGVGAYASALLALRAGLPVAGAIPLAAAAAAILSAFVAVPCLRLRGLYFGMATFAFGYVVYLIAESWMALTRGPMGIPGVPALALPAPTALGLSRDQRLYLVLVGLLGATIFLLHRLLRSPTGRAWIAIRENEDLAATIGVRRMLYAAAAFVLGAFVSGLGGAFFAHYEGFVDPTAADFHTIITAMIMMVAGGTGTLAGPIVGAIVFGILPELLQIAGEARNLVLGGILLAAIAFLPEGLIGIWRRLKPERHAGSPFLPAAAPPPEASVDPRGQALPLEVCGIGKSFAGLCALDAVSFTVNAGEILGIIGPNGAGKTTLFNVVTGFIEPSAGMVRLGERALKGLRPAAVAALGVTRTFQVTSLFSGLSAGENVRTATHLWSERNPFAALFRTRRFRAREEEIERAVDAVLALVELSAERHTAARALSYGDQRRLELAIAIATGSRHLLLDEPAAGLNPAESNRLRNLLRGLRELGFTITLIEHDMKLVMELCDRVVVLNYGRKIAEGTPAEAARHPEVIEAYLGQEEEEDA
jgi:branched-chain amino acid transport system ATP-binding protein/branched-chain amino acid transport system permease protein